MTLIDGTDFDFAQTKGKAVLLVNVATQDKGAEQQFAALNDIYKRYSPAGLMILAFPCNWFGQYEAGSDEEIASRLKELGVNFTVFSKLANFDIESNPAFELGIDAFPGDIIWNFEGKFLFDKRGECVARFDLLSTDDYVGSFCAFLFRSIWLAFIYDDLLDRDSNLCRFLLPCLLRCNDFHAEGRVNSVV